MKSPWLGSILFALLASAVAACGPTSDPGGNGNESDLDARLVADGGVADGSSDGGTDAAADLDAAPGADAASGADAGTSPDASVGPECVGDGDCPGSNRGCYEGVCRDRCVPYLNPCDWAPSGDICLSNYCVECGADADCPGTRYTCDLSTHLCVDRPFNPNITKIGVFYHTWHCPASQDVHDVTQCLAGTEAWPPWPSDPNAQTTFWWGEPAAGYYCLTNNTALLTQHAVMLRDMGADFVFVDVTNHNYNTSSLCDRPEAMIVEPFTSLVNVWSTVPGAPKIVPWVPVCDCPSYLPSGSCNQPDSNYMVYTLLDLLMGSGMQLTYEGKPLLLVTENNIYSASSARLATLSANYTIRKMWAYEAQGTEKWSYLEGCDADPLTGQPCDQRMAVRSGSLEQLPIATAYQADYMSHTNTATPKHHGKTFRKQFETLFNNPEIPIATITGWNEWLVGRWPCGSPVCDCADPFDQTYGCFLDQYTDDYNRDIEPTNNVMGDYYYRLVQSCITLFRAGGRCTSEHANELCCHDYTAP